MGVVGGGLGSKCYVARGGGGGGGSRRNVTIRYKGRGWWGGAKMLNLGVT